MLFLSGPIILSGLVCNLGRTQWLLELQRIEKIQWFNRKTWIYLDIILMSWEYHQQDPFVWGWWSKYDPSPHGPCQVWGAGGFVSTKIGEFSGLLIWERVHLKPKSWMVDDGVWPSLAAGMRHSCCMGGRAYTAAVAMGIAPEGPATSTAACSAMAKYHDFFKTEVEICKWYKCAWIDLHQITQLG